jgi:PhzF family phenazine biosynthesis protein
MPRTFPFYVVAAFSTGPFQGNPAAVVFINEPLETDTLMKIAANFNQPIMSVVGPQIPSADDSVAAFSVRWFTASFHEIPICGHGTMAAARGIFERGLVANSVEVIEFHTLTSGIMRARKVGKDGIEIRLPSGTLTDLPSEESPKITAALVKAFGRDLKIKYMGIGSKEFKSYLVVELDEQENLGKCEVDVSALVSASIDRCQ